MLSKDKEFLEVMRDELRQKYNQAEGEERERLGRELLKVNRILQAN